MRASTSKTVLEKIETIIPEVLTDRNLFVKNQKPKNILSLETQQMNGKTCKLVGSKLETVNDIENRKKTLDTSHTVL